MEPLTDLDRQILTIAGRHYRHAGSSEAAVRAELDLTPTRYYQLLGQVIDKPAALEAEPTLVLRLRRLRDRRVRRAA